VRLAADFLRPQRPLFLAPPWQRGLVFLVLLAALGALLWQARQQDESLQQLTTDAAAWQDKLALLKAPAPSRPALRSQVDVQVQRQLDTPWDGIFAAVERQRSDDIALLGLSADQASREVVLKGEARHLAGLRAFISGLQQEPVLLRVQPSGHKALDSLAGGLAFELRLQWR
jgi:hypothetical protein